MKNKKNIYGSTQKSFPLLLERSPFLANSACQRHGSPTHRMKVDDKWNALVCNSKCDDCSLNDNSYCPYGYESSWKEILFSLILICLVVLLFPR